MRPLPPAPDRCDCRYKWLLKRLEARKDVWGIFPPHWHVQQLLCIMFCNITKAQLAEILDTRVRRGGAVGWQARRQSMRDGGNKGVFRSWRVW